MTITTESRPARPVPGDDHADSLSADNSAAALTIEERLRFAVAGHLGRYKGQTRAHTVPPDSAAEE